MKPNDKAIEAARSAILKAIAERNCIIAGVPFNENNTDEFDAGEAVEHAKVALDAAYAAQFPPSEDYAGLVKELREDVLQFNLKNTVYENIANEAADVLEAVLAERDALKGVVEIYEKKLSGIEDEIRLETQSAIAAVRPHIEAAERERCANVVDEYVKCLPDVITQIAAAIRSGK